MSTAEAAGARVSSSEDATDVGDDGVEVPQAGIGWLRAIGTALAVLVLGFAATVGLTNWLLTDASLSSQSRDHRVWLATAVFLISVAVVAWALRRLQARGLI